MVLIETPGLDCRRLCLKNRPIPEEFEPISETFQSSFRQITGPCADPPGTGAAIAMHHGGAGRGNALRLGRICLEEAAVPDDRYHQNFQTMRGGEPAPALPDLA
ncbi:hypothetical protein ACQKJ1_18565 [Methylorubrum rhodesianum]|uniref:hypothetical protein n=1 Tax=Methylorubrum rhodesianum TaxID=29427 RepID=UPI003D02EEB3